MTDKKFDNRRAYGRAENAVYRFHEKVYNTVLAWLQEHGDRIITDEDNELDEWVFCFLDMEGTYRVNAVRLTDDRQDFYLDTTSQSGDTYAIHWDVINHDMIIENMLMGIVFND